MVSVALVADPPSTAGLVLAVMVFTLRAAPAAGLLPAVTGFVHSAAAPTASACMAAVQEPAPV